MPTEQVTVAVSEAPSPGLSSVITAFYQMSASVGAQIAQIGTQMDRQVKKLRDDLHVYMVELSQSVNAQMTDLREELGDVQDKIKNDRILQMALAQLQFQQVEHRLQKMEVLHGLMQEQLLEQSMRHKSGPSMPEVVDTRGKGSVDMPPLISPPFGPVGTSQPVFADRSSRPDPYTSSGERADTGRRSPIGVG